MSKQKQTICTLLLITLVVILMVLLRCCYGQTSPPDTIQDETIDKHLDFEPAAETATNSISIPGITGLSMKSGQLHQTVDLYNPEENNCYFVISMFLSDDTLIYKSDYLAPAESLTEITLLQTLQRGTYKNCRLVYNCYALDNKAALNSGTVVLEINTY